MLRPNRLMMAVLLTGVLVAPWSTVAAPAASVPAAAVAAAAVIPAAPAAASRPATAAPAAKPATTTATTAARSQPQHPVLTMVATAYDATWASNGRWGPVAAWHALPLALGIVAVDPQVIPLGSRLLITGYHSPYLPAGGLYALAADTGGAIVGDRIDVFMPTTSTQTSKFGIQKVRVEVLSTPSGGH